jgi:NAD(P)H-hydrate epimerase
MRPVLTPAEMAEADRRAIAAGAAEATLVERAGRAVAWTVRRILGGTYGRRAVVVAGKGNNGADGRVAARVLRGWGVRVDELSLEAGVDAGALSRALGRADVFVDAMFGTGFRGMLEGDAATVADAIDEARWQRGAALRVVAVDIPSGVDGGTGAVHGLAVRADATVCFAALKPGHLFEPGRSHAGRIEVVDIGIDVDELGAAAVLAPADVFVPTRAPSDHKWTSSVMVVAGSLGMLGAASLVSRAAARCGAGMVVCGVPGREAAARVSGSEVVTRALPATPEGALDEEAARLVLRDLSRFDALAVGPGLGRDDRTRTAVARLVAESSCPVVIDADALHALAIDPAPLRVRHAAGLPPAVLTPHAGEFERLAGRPVGDDRVDAARQLARELRCVVLLKGPGTVIADPGGSVIINTTDVPALASAGTGDVLTGMLGGLLAASCEPWMAAASAAYLHGLAARLAGTRDALVAGDLVDALPRTLTVLTADEPDQEA